MIYQNSALNAYISSEGKQRILDSRQFTQRILEILVYVQHN